ncbi:hypothetical protein WMF28_33410 [Sorangium sp. So ce590]|uniref:hypothetical protein n=1 Tax=Sorangium sp. So ce590 TaxID=3133317 RepID=UPI003F5FEAC9
MGCGGHVTSGGQSSDLEPDEQLAPEAPDDVAPAGEEEDASAGGGGAAPTAGEPPAGCTPAEGDPDCSEGSQPEPPELACAEPVSLDDAEARPRAELECCLGYASERMPAGPTVGLSEQELAALAEDASLVNCCTALIVGVDADAISFAEAEPVRGACCVGDVVAPEEELWRRTFCTPWGPPVPPALEADAASEVA